jgi:hypothetical protein
LLSRTWAEALRATITAAAPTSQGQIICSAERTLPKDPKLNVYSLTFIETRAARMTPRG